jgi:hypothetical protein
MFVQALLLASGLLFDGDAPAPQVDQRKAETASGWVVELRGYTYHRDARPKIKWIIEVQWPEPKPKVEPVEAHYHDDLRPFFDRLKQQKR